MNIAMFKNRAFNEILSITGIMAIFFYLDVKFGILISTSQFILKLAPDLDDYMITLVGCMWAGLMVYSFFRRRQTMSAIRAGKHVKAELDCQKLINQNTGLPNRKGFERVVNTTSILLDYPFWTILAIEMRNAKSLNNVYGIETGKAIERVIAARISEISGGKEFIAMDEGSVFYLICPSVAEDEADFRADQIVEEMLLVCENGIKVDDKIYNVQFGFAGLRSSSINRKSIRPEMDGLAKRLSFALRQREHNNKIVCFDATMEVEMQRQLLIEAQLSEAVKTNQIIPNFQPIIDLNTSHVVGFEVLARWHHPAVGDISPEEFVPVAEEQGLLGEMTINLMRLSCEVAQYWPEHITMAINISPTDLHNENMVLDLIDIMNEYGIDPHRLEIEITEQAFVADAECVNHAVNLLKEQGISISIDDFGTGYSSLHQLRTIAFDKIKIDQSFIKELSTNLDSQAIVKSVIALGESLGLAVIAEGIEVDVNFNVLKQMGCKHGQGYLFARPMSGVDVLTLFEEENGKLNCSALAA